MFMLSQALDSLDNLEVQILKRNLWVTFISQRKFISSLLSIPVDQAVMLILVMKTQQQQKYK